MSNVASGETSGPRTVLSVGSGLVELSQWSTEGYRVIRLDIDPRAEPDILANMTDMGEIGPYDVVYSSHSLEHLYPHEVPKALSEFYRVLKPSGVCIVVVPDLEDVPATDELLPGSKLTGLHLYYGDSQHIPEFPHMAHHSGFVAKTLDEAMTAAGFDAQTRRLPNYNLLGIGHKRAQGGVLPASGQQAIPGND